MKLTKAQREIMTLLVENQDEEDGELVGSGLVYYIGDRQVAARTVRFFLMNVLIRECSFSDHSYRIYYANEYTKKALADPDWSLEAEIERSKLIGVGDY